MRAVVVGAGEVGFSVAKNLSDQGHDVVVVENDDLRAEKVESDLDVLLVRGNGARPPVLEEAGITPGCNVDILIACTNHDEVNILACWIAKRAGVKRVISRARGLEYTDSPTWARDLGIDVMISPERSVAREIEELLAVSSAVHTAEFFGGRAGLYAFRVSEGSPMVGDTLRSLRRRYPKLTALIAFVERNGSGFVPFGETELKVGDLCFIIVLRGQVHQLEELFRKERSKGLKRVIIVGGGKIGFQVARRLEMRYRNLDVRLIDQDREKCDKLARELERTIVLAGDGTDEELLHYEGVEDADGFVTTTASDERNLLIGVIGKALGAGKSIAVVRRNLLMKLDDYISVDALVNPNQALASVIMRQVRYPFSSGALSIIEKIDAEMLEVTVQENSRIVGKQVMDLGLPKGILLALICRNEQVFVPWGDTVLQPHDQIVLFASSEQMPKAVEILEVQ